MEAGLAASAVTNTYGNGAGNTVIHAYGGAGNTPKQSVSKKKVKSKKKKGSTMACGTKKKKPGKK